MTAESIKRLRERSGAGINDVKRALEASEGDEERAFDLLRKEGKKIAQKKADRVTREGVVGSYVHTDKKIAALVSVACETDFVARNETFRAFAHDLALHVAAMSPTYLSKNDIPAPEEYVAEHCLLDQPFVKDATQTIQELLDAMTAKLGEKIEIRQFVRFTL